jgi:ATP-binding cassette subfamily B protein
MGTSLLTRQPPDETDVLRQTARSTCQNATHARAENKVTDRWTRGYHPAVTSPDAQPPVSIAAADTIGPPRPAPPRQTPAAALWRVREYLRPYYRQLVIMLAAALIATGTEIVIPLLTKAAIDGPISSAARAGSAAAHGRVVLIWIGIGAIALGSAEVGFSMIRRWVQANAVARLEQSMRDDLYAHLQRLEPGFHDAWQSGQLLSRATTDLSAIRRFAGFGTIFIITSVVSFGVIVALLVILNPLLGLLTAVLFMPITWLCLRFERRYRVLSRRVQDQQDDLATSVEEAAAGIRILKALGRRDLAMAGHRQRAEIVYRTQVSKAALRGTFWAGLDLLPNAAIALVLLLGAIAVSHGALTVGGLVAFIALVLQLVWPIEATGYILALGQEAATAAQRVYEILDTPPAISGPADTEAAASRSLAGPGSPAPAPAAGAAVPGTAARGPIPPRAGTSEVPSARRVPMVQVRRPPAQRPPAQLPPVAASAGGRLVLEHVGFTYPGSDRPVLRDVCLELTPGETVALVGATGAGKTTLLSLIARLEDATSGTIALDGTDIRNVPLTVLRSQVACAFEDPTLFSVSARENITLGNPQATDAAVRTALAAAQAQFVDELPWGLDTRIGEQGMSLSGGQRQRIALARAILASPSVLLLDDPLSAVDVHTEAKVTQALGQVLSTSTALIVAHRPSTVALADRVVVLEDGEIRASGTHHELLASDAQYQHLMSSDADTGARR